MRALRETLVLVAILIVALASCVVYGQTTKPITFEWDCPGCTEDEVTEFVLYESTTGSNPLIGTWTAVATIPVTELTAVEELSVNTGRHWYYVTAKNGWGESDPSNVVQVNTQKPRVLIFRIRIVG